MIRLKHILPVFASAALMSCGMMKSSGPEPFVGQITYSMNFSSPEGEENPMLESMSSMFPSEMVQGTDGTDFGMKMDGMQAMHLVAKANENMFYISTQGQFIKQPMPAEDSTETSSTVSVEETGDTKEILGYKCKGFKISDDESETIVYVTDQFEINQPAGMSIGASSEALEMVVGTPLYTSSTVNQGGQKMVITLEATSIVEGAEAASEIVTPAEGEYVLMEN